MGSHGMVSGHPATLPLDSVGGERHPASHLYYLVMYRSTDLRCARAASGIWGTASAGAFFVQPLLKPRGGQCGMPSPLQRHARDGQVPPAVRLHSFQLGSFISILLPVSIVVQCGCLSVVGVGGPWAVGGAAVVVPASLGSVSDPSSLALNFSLMKRPLRRRTNPLPALQWQWLFQHRELH